MTARALVVTVGVSLLAAAGCRVDQAAEVASYRRAVDLPIPQPATRPSGPLGLRGAMLLANALNERLDIQGEALLRATIQRRRTLAAFLPTVQLVPTYSLREQTGGGSGSIVTDPNGPGTFVSDASSTSRFDAPVDLNYNLFNGLRDRNALRRDAFLIAARRNDLLAEQEQLLLDVAQAYFGVLRSEQTVRVLEASLATQAERLREARGRVAAGLASSLAESQIRAQESATRSTQLAARRDVLQLRAALAQLVALPLQEVALVDDAAQHPTEALAALNGLIAQAMAGRNELDAADAAVSAARRDVAVASGQYYPSIAVRLTGFLYRESVPTDRDWDALFSANVPIFAAGRIRADVREAWSLWREARLVREGLAREIERQVRAAHAAVEASDLRLAEAQVQVEAARLALRQAEENYRAGLATNLDRIVAQEELLNAELLLTSEQFDRRIFRLDLLRATGQLREWLAGAPGLPPDATTQPSARAASESRSVAYHPSTALDPRPAGRNPPA